VVGRFFGVGWEGWEAEGEDDKVVDCCGDGFLLCWRHFGGLERVWFGLYGRCRKAGSFDLLFCPVILSGT